MRAVLAAVLLPALLVAGPPRATAASPAVLLRDGAWSWFGEPRAVVHRGRIVVGAVDRRGDVVVAERGRRPTVLHERLERDDHDNPSLYVRRDGRLMAFWSAHGGDRIYFRTAIDGVSRWGPVGTVPGNAPGFNTNTYPTPIRVGRRLHLLWRGANHKPTLATSGDDGATWSAPRTLIDAQGAYVKYARDRDGIHAAWVVRHPRAGASGVYHAVLRHGVFFREDGTRIGPPPIAATAGEPVYDAAIAGGAWVHDVRAGVGGVRIAYATFPTIANHSYRVAEWRHGRWLDRRVADAGPSFDPGTAELWYSGGITLTPGGAYLSRLVGGQFEIERWRPRRGRWHRQRALTTGSQPRNVRPFAVAGGVAWMRGRYDSFTEYDTRIVWAR